MTFSLPDKRLIVRLGRHLALGGLVAVVLAACTAYPEQMDLPGVQKLTWYSYLNGDDLRGSCQPGTPGRYRFVYNADYNKQLRTYDVRVEGDAARVLARVQSGRGIAASRITLTLDDPIASWRWRSAENRLDSASFGRLEAALTQSGLFEPAPQGLKLYSDAFYWVASGCKDGQFFFQAWDYPSDRFQALSFPALLLASDGTGMPVIPPQPRDLAAQFRRQPSSRGPNQDASPYFVLEVGRNGLVGRPGA